ncbi:hypothetical protein Esti_001933 [Eimeria stiedai]
MPGIYSKPPRRVEFAADMRCIVEAAAASFSAGEDWPSYVSTLVDEMEKERAKARQEVSEECENQGEIHESNHRAGGRTKSHQQQVARKEIEVAEVFFECGVHSFFCKVLEEANPSVHLAVFEQILGVYGVYQLIEVDPFDDDMGLVSLLNFFLSERHSYYIDIHWRENELSHMQAFISSLLKLASFRAGLPEGFSCVSTQSTASESSLPDTPTHKAIDSALHLSTEAARLLHVCLWTFPPHRVVSRMALSFSRVRCAELLRSFSCSSIDSESGSLSEAKLLQLKVETVAAIAFFGVGPSLTRKAARAALAWSCSSFACRDERCPCSSCEFQRRLLKLLRCRDELGVQASTEAKRQICFALVRANVTDFLDQALRATITAETGSAEIQQVVGNILEAVGWILLLCSWAYEDMNQGQSILSANNSKLMASTVNALHARNEASSGVDFVGGPSGASTLLRVLLHLSLKTNVAERRRLTQLGEPQLAQIASCLCSRLEHLSPTAGTAAAEEVQNQDLDQEQGSPEASFPVPANDASLDPKEKALTSCLLLLGLAQLLFDHEVARGFPPASTASEEGAGSQQQKAAVSGETIAQTARACQALVEIYEYIHPRFAHLKKESHAAAEEDVRDAAPRPPTDVSGQAGFEPREFFLGIVGVMALLMGSLALQGVEQVRWRFIENPLATALPATAGGLASSARSMLAHYKKTQDEGCEIVKKLAGLVVLRSEQAAGMVLRTRASS